MKTKMESLTLPTPDKFTDSWLARVQLKPGTNAREREVFELSGSGLGVRIRANGGKSLTVQKAKHGVELRRTLGAWPQLTLAAARKAVEALIGRMAAGFDVNQEHRDKIAKAKAPKPATLAELVDRWEREGLAQQRDSYRKRALASVRYTFRPMMRTPITDLSGEAIEAVLDEAIKRGPAAARMAGISLRTCLNWGVSKRALAVAPKFAAPAATPGRERVLSEDELRRMYAAAGTLPAPRGQLFQTRDAYRVPAHRNRRIEMGRGPQPRQPRALRNQAADGQNQNPQRALGSAQRRGPPNPALGPAHERRVRVLWRRRQDAGQGGVR